MHLVTMRGQNVYYQIEMITWNHIIIRIRYEYLKLDKCAQSNDYYLIEMVLDGSTWNLAAEQVIGFRKEYLISYKFRFWFHCLMAYQPFWVIENQS